MNDIKHHCGIVGVYGHPNAAKLAYESLWALQHRGNEGAGMVASNGDGPFLVHKDMGLIAQVFGNGALDRLVGHTAIAHTRYSTTGGTGRQNLQPLAVDCHHGQIALGHNGNLVNTVALRRELLAQNVVFQTDTDSEVMLHLVARHQGTLREAIIAMMERVAGAYSLVILTKDQLIGVRDQNGFRPLCLGMLGRTHILASETCALDRVGASFVREIEPGETVFISRDGLRSEKIKCPALSTPSFCVFEYVYFGRPDSVSNGRSLYEMRRTMGEILAEEQPCFADIVVPVPDSGNAAALGYSRVSGIPIEFALVRDHFAMGRSFLQPKQKLREEQAKWKLSLVPSLVKGLRVVIVDDSIVRGTTLMQRLEGFRAAGAREIHVRVSCPPHRHPCHYGIDFPDSSKLIAVQHEKDELRKALGVTSLGYLSEAGLLRAVGTTDVCMACYNGRYPVAIPDEAAG